jgi:aminoglycoside phosphotransferase family enzyme/predicted kinase
MTGTPPPVSTPLDAAATMVQALRTQLGARLIETHISWVLLGPRDAWKIKKPVHLAFLDCTALATREHLCHEECRLNRCLAPQLYLGVVPITGTAAAPCLGGAGAAIDFALHMRRFDDGALMSEQLAAGTLMPAHLDALAARLAAFHRTADRATPAMPYGQPEAIMAATQGVLDGLHARGLADACAPIAAWLADQAQRLAPLWRQRLAQGHVVDGHGDLHLANVVLLPDGVTAFDCIEFDPALRWIDAINDIAFVVMDLMAHGRADLAWRFLNAYLDDTGDHAGLPTLRYDLVYRALVRALVARLAAAGAAPPPALARPDYLRLAGQLIQPPDPRLLITHGLSGSGKSFVTQALLAQVGAIRLRSDVERKRLFGLSALADSAVLVPGGIYGDAATQASYAHLRAMATQALVAGYRVVVDAAFLHHAEREAFRAMAANCQVPFAILHCEAPAAVLRERVATRQRQGKDPSEADLNVLARQLEQVKPLHADELACTIPVNTAQALDLVSVSSRWLHMR